MTAFFKKYGAWICLFFLAGVFVANPALAQVAEDNVLDSIVTKYRDAVRPWHMVLTNHAQRLFWLLVAIDFAWNAIKNYAKRSDLQDIVFDLMQMILLTGFYLALIRYSDSWLGSIIDSFRKAATEANTAIGGVPSGYGPSDIFDAGLTIAIRVTDSITFLAPGDSVAIALAALAILIAFALVAAQVLVTLVEMYIALGAGVFLLGFGGSRWTRDIATNQLNYVAGVGAKLFGMHLIIGIGQTFILGWFSTYQPSWSQLLVLVGTAIVYVVLTYSVPAMLQSLVGKINVASAGQQIISTVINSATQGAALAAGAATQAFGGALAAKEAFQLAGLQGGPNSSLPDRILGAANLMGGSLFDSTAGKMSGNPAMQGGNAGGRMAADLKEQRLRFTPEKPNTNVPEFREPEPEETIPIPRALPRAEGKQDASITASHFEDKGNPSFRPDNESITPVMPSFDAEAATAAAQTVPLPSFEVPDFALSKPNPVAETGSGSWDQLFGSPDIEPKQAASVPGTVPIQAPAPQSPASQPAPVSMPAPAVPADKPLFGNPDDHPLPQATPRIFGEEFLPPPTTEEEI